MDEDIVFRIVPDPLTGHDQVPVLLSPGDIVISTAASEAAIRETQYRIGLLTGNEVREQASLG